MLLLPVLHIILIFLVSQLDAALPAYLRSEGDGVDLLDEQASSVVSHIGKLGDEGVVLEHERVTNPVGYGVAALAAVDDEEVIGVVVQSPENWQRIAWCREIHSESLRRRTVSLE